MVQRFMRKARWWFVNPEGPLEKTSRLIYRAFEVLREEGASKFLAAIWRKILLFFGIRTNQVGIRPTIKAIKAIRTIGSEATNLYDVIVFPIIGWDFRIQRPQQIALQFAQAGHRVFYIAPTFQDVSNSVLWEIGHNVYGVILPGPSDLLIYNSEIRPDLLARLEKAFSYLTEKARFNETIQIVDLPFWQPLAFALREKYGWKVIYDCMDLHAHFPDTTETMLEYEDNLSRGSDLVLASSCILFNKNREQNPNTIHVPNACDFDHFHTPQDPPENLCELKHPIVGYYGAISTWFDSCLVAELAQQRPEWTFLLVGNTAGADLTPFEGLENIITTGEQLYDTLPGYLHQFDTCIIPFVKTPLTDATNPVKLFEFLSAGKSITATRLEEISLYQDYVTLAEGTGEWLAAIEANLKANSEDEVQRRVNFARQNTWSHRFNELEPKNRMLFPKVSIIIVTYNNVEFTRLCLQSILEKTAWSNYEAIVVDNASMDDTPFFLTSNYGSRENFKVILNDQNTGFAAANNQAARVATGDYLIFLNNDTIVTPGWINGLLRHLRNPAVGMVGPVTNFSGNESKISVGYKDVRDMETFAWSYTTKHFGETFDIDMLAFFCLCIRRETWTTVGELDERFGTGMFEDDDYAVRVRKLGLRILCARDVFIHHWGKVSFSKIRSDHYKKLFVENKAKFEEKWQSEWEDPVLREKRNE